MGGAVAAAPLSSLLRCLPACLSTAHGISHLPLIAPLSDDFFPCQFQLFYRGKGKGGMW